MRTSAAMPSIHTKPAPPPTAWPGPETGATGTPGAGVDGTPRADLVAAPVACRRRRSRRTEDLAPAAGADLEVAPDGGADDVLPDAAFGVAFEVAFDVVFGARVIPRPNSG
jgi:hypothetical protein